MVYINVRACQPMSNYYGSKETSSRIPRCMFLRKCCNTGSIYFKVCLFVGNSVCVDWHGFFLAFWVRSVSPLSVDVLQSMRAALLTYITNTSAACRQPSCHGISSVWSVDPPKCLFLGFEWRPEARVCDVRARRGLHRRPRRRTKSRRGRSRAMRPRCRRTLS